jgi:hypothetical protein
LLAQLIRDRIGQTKGDEINRALLLPMRKTVFSMTDIGIWVEELQCVHQKKENGAVKLRRFQNRRSLISQAH